MPGKKSNKRVPAQVSPEFRDEFLKLKGIMLQNGSDISMPQLTKELVNTKAFQELQSKLLRNELKLDIKLRFDRRRI